MNTPDPTPPNKTLAPSLSDKASALAGGPLAAIGAYLWSTLTHTQASTPEAVALAAGAGGIFATVIGYLWHVTTVLIERRLERP